VRRLKACELNASDRMGMSVPDTGSEDLKLLSGALASPSCCVATLVEAE